MNYFQKNTRELMSNTFLTGVHGQGIRRDRTLMGVTMQYSEKHKAKIRKQTQQLIKEGKLVYWKCEDCGADEHLEMHHETYDDPTDVQCLCKLCHEKRHHDRGFRESDKDGLFDPLELVQFNTVPTGSKPLTYEQARAYRLVFPGCGGLTREQAAQEMGITIRAFNYLLERARNRRPNLFPIMTQQEYDVLLMAQAGLDRYEIANRTMNSETGQPGVHISRVADILASLRGKGCNLIRPHNGEMVRFESWMDDQVKEKF